MLTADRPEMTRRAIEEWRLQTYKRKCLVVLDSGREHLKLKSKFPLIYIAVQHDPQMTVGELRNIANNLLEVELIAHLDSDDWSHPERLSEQVERLAGSKIPYDAVGYHDMLFWSTVPETAGAWYYSSASPDFALGGSLLYWRKTWAKKPFHHGPVVTEAKPRSEDTIWIRGLRIRGASMFGQGEYYDPRMICRKHDRNTAAGIQPGYNTGERDRTGRYRRALEYDALCERFLGSAKPVRNPADKLPTGGG